MGDHRFKSAPCIKEGRPQPTLAYPSVDRVEEKVPEKEGVLIGLGYGDDLWGDKEGMICNTCAFFVEKKSKVVRIVSNILGRCRRRAPTMNGYPAVFSRDWCGDHKLK